jgi:ribosomal protein L7/L12
MERIWFFIVIGLFFTVIGVLIERGRRAARRGEVTAPQPVLPPDLGAFDDGVFRERVVGLVEAGNKIEAIKLVRERTRLGLAESKALVEALERGDASVDISEAAVDPAADVARVALDDPDLAAQLVIEIAAGRKIEAIRLLRERTGLGLKEAKDAIEAMERDG